MHEEGKVEKDIANADNVTCKDANETQVMDLDEDTKETLNKTRNISNF